MSGAKQSSRVLGRGKRATLRRPHGRPASRASGSDALRQCVLIDYLTGDSTAVQYVEDRLDERAVAPPLVLFEVYQGEVFKSGVADYEAVDDALSWVTVVEADREAVRTAAVVQNELHDAGTAFAPRDAFVAGTAVALDEPLAVSDSDFDAASLSEIVDIDLL